MLQLGGGSAFTGDWICDSTEKGDLYALQLRSRLEPWAKPLVTKIIRGKFKELGYVAKYIKHYPLRVEFILTQDVPKSEDKKRPKWKRNAQETSEESKGVQSPAPSATMTQLPLYTALEVEEAQLQSVPVHTHPFCSKTPEATSLCTDAHSSQSRWWGGKNG